MYLLDSDQQMQGQLELNSEAEDLELEQHLAILTQRPRFKEALGPCLKSVMDRRLLTKNYLT